MPVPALQRDGRGGRCCPPAGRGGRGRLTRVPWGGPRGNGSQRSPGGAEACGATGAAPETRAGPEGGHLRRGCRRWARRGPRRCPPRVTALPGAAAESKPRAARRGIPPGLREAPQRSGSLTDSGAARGTCPGVAQCGRPSRSPDAPVPRRALREEGTAGPAAVRGQRRGGDAGLPQPTRGHGSARTAAARGRCPVPAVPRPRGGAPRFFGRPRGTPAGSPRRRSPPHGGTRSSGAAAPWWPRRRGSGGPPGGAGLRVHPFAAVPPASPSRRCRFRFCSAAGAKARPGRTRHRRSRPPPREPPAARNGAAPAGPQPHAAVRGRAARRAPRVRPPPLPRASLHPCLGRTERASQVPVALGGRSGARPRRPRAASAGAPRPRTRAWSRGAAVAPAAAARGRPAGPRAASGSGGVMAAALRRLCRAGPRAVTGYGAVRCGAARAAGGSGVWGVPARAHRAEPPPVSQGAAPRAPPDAVGRRDVPADAGDGAAAREPQRGLHRGLQRPRVQHQRQRGGRAVRRAAPRHPAVEREWGAGRGPRWGGGRAAPLSAALCCARRSDRTATSLCRAWRCSVCWSRG